MQALTPEGQQIANDLSQRYGFSTDAIIHMLIAVLNGNGTMAQFSHPEFGGSGQWMQGGMIMLGDMFNHGLKGSIDGLCNEIARLYANQPGLLSSGSFQSQSQGNDDQQSQASGATMGQSSLFVPDPHDQWYPADLGQPSSTGSQNNIRYAYFAQAQRLAVDSCGDVWVYDTLDHQIGGFSQQQGMGGSITFTSQYGTVNLSSLPVVLRNGQPVQASQAESPQPDSQTPSQTPEPREQTASETETPASGTVPSSSRDIIDALERLGTLREKGIVTEEEFAAKKTDLLARL